MSSSPTVVWVLEEQAERYEAQGWRRVEAEKPKPRRGRPKKSEEKEGDGDA
jgi:hypothetical protein